MQRGIDAMLFHSGPYHELEQGTERPLRLELRQREGKAFPGFADVTPLQFDDDGLFVRKVLVQRLWDAFVRVNSGVVPCATSTVRTSPTRTCGPCSNRRYSRPPAEIFSPTSYIG